MESVAQSDALIRLAFVTGLAATAFTVVVIFWMTTLRLFTRYRHRQLDRRSSKWLEILREGRKVLDADLPALPRRAAFVLMHQWMAAMDETDYLHDGPCRRARQEQLRVTADHVGMEEFALELLEDGTKDQVMGAAIALGRMQASRGWLPLRRYLHSADSYLSAACAEALVRIDSAKAIDDLVDAVRVRPEWPEHVLARMLMQIDTADVEFIIKSIARESDYEAMLRLYRALERNNDDRTTVVLDWLFKHARTEADLIDCVYGALQEDRLQAALSALRSREEMAITADS